MINDLPKLKNIENNLIVKELKPINIDENLKKILPKYKLEIIKIWNEELNKRTNS